MSIQRILVASDFSDDAETATRQAMNLARHTGADLVLAHACELEDAPVDSAARSLGQSAMFHEAHKLAVEEARKQLDEIRWRLSGQGSDISDVLVDRPVHEGVCTAAEEMEVDLVVVGSHGRTGFKRFLMGSVAEKIARSCRSNVLVARNDAGAGGFRRVAVPTDFSATSERAIETALSLAADGAVISLIHSWRMPIYSDHAGPHWPVSDIGRQLEEHATERLESLRERYQRTRVEVVAELLRGPPGVAIRNWLDDSETELVVMGSRGKKGVKRFLLGSVAEATIRHAPCSVMVVHPQ